MKPQIFLLLGLALAGCSQATAEPITDEEAFVAARSAVLAILKNPESAKFGTLTRKITGDKLNEFEGHLRRDMVDKRTDLICGTVNAKNSFGGYTGAVMFAYRINRKDVFMDGMDRLNWGHAWCATVRHVP